MLGIPKFRLLPAILGIGLVGCGNPEITVYQVPKAPQPPAQAAAAPQPAQAAPSAGVLWKVPPGWIEKPASGMRLASFEMPTADGKGDCSIITLAGDGGGTLNNLNRWRSQLGLDPIPPSELDSAMSTRTGGFGDYSFFRIVNPEVDEKAFLVSIIHTDRGALFVKLTASRRSIDSLTEPFQALSDSIHIPDE